LADALTAVRKRANKEIAEIDLKIHLNQTFLLGGVISSVRHVQTRKSGKDMCFGTLEDQTGNIRFVVFPRTYQKYGQLFEQDNVLLIKGQVNEREGELNFIVEKASEPKTSEVEYENEKDYHEIFIPRKTSKEILTKLGELLKSHHGDDRVIVIIPNGGRPRRMKLPYTVKFDQKLEEKINQLLT
jgi:DNA polymerase-3 subunit alpha